MGEVRRLEDLLRPLGADLASLSGAEFLARIGEHYGLTIVVKAVQNLHADLDISAFTLPSDDLQTFYIAVDQLLSVKQITHSLRHEGWHILGEHFGPLPAPLTGSAPEPRRSLTGVLAQELTTRDLHRRAAAGQLGISAWEVPAEQEAEMVAHILRRKQARQQWAVQLPRDPVARRWATGMWGGAAHGA